MRQISGIMRTVSGAAVPFTFAVILSAFSVCFTSCTKEDAGQVSGDVIEFSADLDSPQPSKAVTPTTATTLQSGFKVAVTRYGVDGSVSCIDATTKYVSSKYQIKEYQYSLWQPQYSRIDVLAFDNNLTLTKKDNLPYLVKPTSTATLSDYVVADATNRTRAMGEIPLTFRHIASTLNILAKTDNSSVTVKLTKVTLHRPKIAGLQGYILSEKRWRFMNTLDEKEDIALVTNARTLTTAYPTLTSVSAYLARTESTATGQLNFTNTALVIPTEEPQSLTVKWDIYDSSNKLLDTFTKDIAITFIQGRLNLLWLNFTYDNEVQFTITAAGQSFENITGTGNVTYAW